ncbi:MAG: hypothetical protein ACYDAJ_11445 [Nitrosotalea sp.]
MKTLHLAIIVGIVLTGVTIFVVQQWQSNPSGTNTIIKLESPLQPTQIHSEIFPDQAMTSLNGLSVKGYLTDQNDIPLADKEIGLKINNVTFDNGTTILENIPLGKTYTNKHGCFYFANWNQDALDQFQKDMLEKAPHYYTPPSNLSGIHTITNSIGMNDITFIDASFLGDSQFIGSTNSTKIMYHPIIPPIIREPINAFLINSSSLDFINGSSLELERGKSYNFKVYSTWSESMNIQSLRVEIKNLPCGINVPASYVSDLTNKTQLVPIMMTIDKTVPLGNFSTFVSVNNRPLEPINLVIK